MTRVATDRALAKDSKLYISTKQNNNVQLGIRFARFDSHSADPFKKGNFQQLVLKHRERKMKMFSFGGLLAVMVIAVGFGLFEAQTAEGVTKLQAELAGTTANGDALYVEYAAQHTGVFCKRGRCGAQCRFDNYVSTWFEVTENHYVAG